MSTLFALVISVCALTGKCSDVLIGVYDTEKICTDAASEQQVNGQCMPYKQAFAAADDQQPAVSY